MTETKENINASITKAAIAQGQFDPGKVPLTSWQFEMEGVKFGLLKSKVTGSFSYTGKANIKSAKKLQKIEIKLGTLELLNYLL